MRKYIKEYKDGKGKIMYKRIRKSVCLFLSLIMIFTGIPEMAQAKGSTAQAKKAKRVYAKILSSEKAAESVLDMFTSSAITTYQFALIDLNKDGVQELVFTPDDGYHVNVVAYVNGKARCVGGGFAGGESYYPNKHIFVSSTWHMGNYVSYYKFNGKEMKEVASKYNERADMVEYQDDYTYQVNGKTVTKSKYESCINKLMKGAKKQELKWHKNTVTNRKKYLNSPETVATVYGTSGDCISTFSRKNGKLTVRATDPIFRWTESADGSSNVVKTKTKRLCYSLAENCKWNVYNVGESKPSGKISYTNLKKELRNEYLEAVKNGFYDSPTSVHIYVRNNKIVEVRAVYP